MKFFSWTANSTSQAILLGVSLSVLWAFQHPLQGPLYKIFGRESYGVFSGIFLAEAVFLACCICSFLIKNVRQGCVELLNIGSMLWYIPAASILSVVGLIFYAIGQSRVDSTQVAILLNASPLAVLFSSFILTEENWSHAIWKALVSRDFRVHILLACVVASLTWFGASSGWGRNDVFASFLILLVPVFYFASGHILRSKYFFSPDAHLASMICTGVIACSLSMALILLFLARMRLPLLIGGAPLHVFAMFCIAAVISVYFGSLVLQVFLRQREGVRRLSMITFHSVPFFSMLISMAAHLIWPQEVAFPNVYYIISAIIVGLALLFFKRSDMVKGVS